jgi:hypothetical protein
MKNSLRLVAMLALALGANGCILIADFDPTGGPVSLTGEWNIDVGDGQLAPDEFSCTLAGISDLELRIYDDEFLNHYSDATLTFPCEAGAFISQPMLMHGLYRTRWVALDEQGFEVARSALEPLDVTLVTSAVVAPATFVVTSPAPLPQGDLELTLEWDTDPSSFFTAGTCGSAKVDSLKFRVLDGFGALLSEGDAPCTESLIFEDLAYGDYSVEIVGLLDGVTYWNTLCSPLSLSAPQSGYICSIDRTDF